MPTEEVLKLLHERMQPGEAPAGSICTLCDKKFHEGDACLMLRAPVNLVITTKWVTEYACPECGGLIGNRILSVARNL